jgi:hypothetical protein
MLEHISNVAHDGAGKVYEQFPEPGSFTNKRSTVRIKLKETI